MEFSEKAEEKIPLILKDESRSHDCNEDEMPIDLAFASFSKKSNSMPVFSYFICFYNAFS